MSRSEKRSLPRPDPDFLRVWRRAQVSAESLLTVGVFRRSETYYHEQARDLSKTGSRSNMDALVERARSLSPTFVPPPRRQRAGPLRALVRARQIALAAPPPSLSPMANRIAVGG